MPLVRTTGVLPEELENIVTQTIGACIAVHRRLGPGLSETIYQRALMVELKFHGLAAEFEKPVPVHYRGELLCNQRIDLVVEDGLIVEVKSVEAIHAVHVAQAVGYLRLTGLRVALVVNFNVPVLRQGIRRVVL